MDAQKVHEELRELKDDVLDIKRAVIGDPKFGQVGLVRRVQRIEEKQMKLFLKIAAIGAGMGGVVSAVAEIVKHATK